MVRCNIVLQLHNTSYVACAKQVINAKPEIQARLRHGSGRGVQKWIDSLRVYCKGGHGGNGHPKYGGIGGKGGDIIIQASDNIAKNQRASKQKAGAQKTLASLYDVFHREFQNESTNQRLAATPGDDANRSKLIGPSGKDRILKVKKLA